MNISRLSSVPASAQPVAARPYQAPKVANDPDNDGDSKPQAPLTNLGVQTTQPESPSQQDVDYSTRMANFANRIENRVQNAIDTGNLSPDQTQALQDASTQFQALMNRIGNADFSSAPKRQVLYALHQLTHQIQSILHPQQSPTATADVLKGNSGVATTAVAPSVDTVA